MVNGEFRSTLDYGFEMVDSAWNHEQRSSIENLRENSDRSILSQNFGELSPRQLLPIYRGL
jgi:hypothetical protein